jgi:hypothetical protein
VASLANFALFQAVWFAAVLGTAAGHPWLGPVVLVPFLAGHMAMIRDRRERAAELRFVLAAGVLGSLADSGLLAAGITSFPGEVAGWPDWLVPPWITVLWTAFAALPRFSLGWLCGRPALAALLGAVGGPLSFLAGERLGAVGTSDPATTTVLALGVQYALVTPLLCRLAPASRAR